MSPTYLRFPAVRRISILVLLSVVAWNGAAGADEKEAEETVVVYNRGNRDSRELARYYAERRGIPERNLFGLRCSNGEIVSRPEFEKKIFQPVLDFLEKGGFLEFADREISVQAPPAADGEPAATRTYRIRQAVRARVRYLVVMYGVPLRIRSDAEWRDRLPTRPLPDPLRRNNASVDSELALLPSPDVPRMGPQANPYYNLNTSFVAPMNRGMLLVTRLDGPSPKVVRRMIDDAVRGDRLGLRGRAYFDLRGFKVETGHGQGDKWLRGAVSAARKAGFDCIVETTSAIFPETEPMTDPAIYMGWYTRDVEGPFTREDFAFRPGAIAYHLHSSSASTVRNPASRWAGPLLDRGATVTMGAVAEPYLQFTPHLDIFMEKILSGYNFAESAYQSIPSLSWQIVALGDPLYRPCGIPIEQQIENARREAPEEVGWLVQRKVRMLSRQGKADEAVALCRRELETRRRDPVLRETLARLLTEKGDTAAAAVAWESAAQIVRGPRDRIRFLRLYARFLEDNDRIGEALDIYREIGTKYAPMVDRRKNLEQCVRLARMMGDEERAAEWQAEIEKLLEPAQEPAR